MSPNRRLSLACLLLALSSPAGAAGTDVAVVQPPATATQAPHPEVILPDVNVPTKGMSMKQVKERFGEPAEVIDPVGKPPITRWNYKDFTVYFEGRFVLHSVVPRSLKIKTMDIGGTEPAPPPVGAPPEEPVQSPFD